MRLERSPIDDTWSEGWFCRSLQVTVRKVGEGIHLRGEMLSAESGRFDYSGLVNDKRLAATV